MKIIFLDIDGVINSELYYKSVNTKKKNWSRFDPKAVEMIKRLVEEFNARIVISSLWRFAMKKELAQELKASGLINFLDKDWQTPVLQLGHRGKEIKLWLDQHPDIVEYVIIDDDSDILEEHLTRFVKTEIHDGMQEEHYYMAREILEDETLL
jgi:hypothetical protein